MAKTNATSATGPFELKVFLPLMQKPFPSGLALVDMENASDPEPGSLIALTATRVPLHRPGRYRRFCSSFPNLQTGIAQESRWAQMEKTSPPSWQPYPSASRPTAVDKGSRPPPPYS